MRLVKFAVAAFLTIAPLSGALVASSATAASAVPAAAAAHSGYQPHICRLGC